MDALVATCGARQDVAFSLLAQSKADPSAAKISATRDAQVQAAASSIALRQALDATQRTGMELSTSVAQQAGVGTRVDTYA